MSLQDTPSTLANGLYTQTIIPTRLTLLTSTKGSISKSYRLKDGDLEKLPHVGIIHQGYAEEIEISGPDDLATLLRTCKSNQALAIGIPCYDGMPDRTKHPITTKAKFELYPEAITRSKEFFQAPPGNSLLLIDLDRKGMPAHIAKELTALGSFTKLLIKVFPWLTSNCFVERASTSSGIYDQATGKVFASSGGIHVYMFADDGADVDRAVKALHKRAWLQGYGWLIVSEKGAILERSIIDRCVGTPERLIYEGAVKLGPGLAQDDAAREPAITYGSVVQTDMAMPDLSAAEEERYEELKKAAYKEIEPELLRVRKKLADEEVPKIMAAFGISKKEAEKRFYERFHGKLYGEVELEFDDKSIGTVTVAEVVANPEKYDGKTLSDPIEGSDYGKGKAKLYVNDDNEIIIHSFAHCGVLYSCHDLTSVFSPVAPQHEEIKAKKPKENSHTHSYANGFDTSAHDENSDDVEIDDDGVDDAFKTASPPPSAKNPDFTYKGPVGSYPDPEPIGVSLLPVPPFNPELLPEAFRDWVVDIAYRMQCPIDYVAVAIMVSAGSVIGRKITIKPSKAGDWVVVPNLWGMIVGRPGVMKTPALEAAMSSLDMLEAQAREKNVFAKDKYAKDKKNADIHNKNLENLAKEAHKKALEKNKDARINTEGNYITVTEPVDKRYIVTDATYEKLGIIVSQNTDGVLYYRDELLSLLRDLAKEENVSARGFFLQAWNGNSPYTFDRVTRESVFIEAVCVSVLGTTQPGPLAELISNTAGTAQDDGMPQRFNMLIWPDCNEPFVERDVAVNKEARTRAHDTFKYLDTLTGDDVDAEMETFDKTPWLAFDDDAYALFSTWRVNLENRLRGSKIKNTALESHLAKYRKLVPALSLILHIVDGGKGPIPQATLTKAIAWAEYLEAHAARTYESEGAAEVATAKSIIERIKKGELTGEFKVRTIVRRGWSGLKNTKMIKAAVDYLEDAKWIIPQQRKSPGSQGGRGSDTTYTINPKALTASVD